MERSENLIGEKIRIIRKERRMTLKELAEGVCSLGKMSNIENGKAVPSSSELKALSAKLRVPVEKITAESFTSSNGFDAQYGYLFQEATYIEDLFRLGLYDEGKSKVEEFHAATRDVEELSILNNFLWAWYYKSIRSYEYCIEILEGISVQTTYNDHQLLIQIRAKNMLSSMYLKEGHLEKTAIILKNLRDQTLKMNFVSEYWKVRYNLCVFFTVKGDYDLAKLYVESLSKEADMEHYARYMLAVLDFINNDLQSATENIYLAKKKFRELGNQEMLLKATLAERFVQLEYIHKGESDFISERIDELRSLSVTLNKEQIRFSVFCLNLLLYLTLEWGLEKEALKIHDYLSSIINEDIENGLMGQACLYLARASHKFKGDIKESLYFIDLGLKTLGQRKYSLYGTLLYEKLKLIDNEKSSLYKEALECFIAEENYKRAVKFNFQHILPEMMI